MTIWFTADTHFWHYHIIELAGRPFGYSKALNREEACIQMNEALIERWNDKVKKDDHIYHLGDFAFAGTGKCKDIFDRLNGRKYLIRGNHDGNSQCKQAWEWVKDYHVAHCEANYQDDEGEIIQCHQPIVLCHYPLLSWNGMAHGSWHLHGHCHGSLRDAGGLRLDVGVDCNDYYPVSFNDIRNKMLLRSVVPVGHHIPKEKK